MDLPEAARRFSVAMSYCIDVIAVHRRAGNGGRGRRTDEVSLNRAVVVMAVGAWQVAVENLTLTGLDLAATHSASVYGSNVQPYVGLVKGAIGRFSTPNSTKSRELLLNVGFDPSSAWAGYSQPGPASGRRLQDVLDDWLKIRHAIAHANAPLPAVDVLQYVRDYRKKQLAAGVPQASFLNPRDPRLRLVDAELCVAFVRRIATVTGDAFAAQMSLTAVPWR